MTLRCMMFAKKRIFSSKFESYDILHTIFKIYLRIPSIKLSKSISKAVLRKFSGFLENSLRFFKVQLKMVSEVFQIYLFIYGS